MCCPHIHTFVAVVCLIYLSRILFSSFFFFFFNAVASRVLSRACRSLRFRVRMIAPVASQEIECDVSVAEGDKRQEFSFTLYDFDGHGKITKDDIAGLVTSIYDTLGGSVQVPPCGSKTIKVKLTVSPDQRASNSSNRQQSRNVAANNSLNATQQATPQTAASNRQNSSSCCDLKHTNTTTTTTVPPSYQTAAPPHTVRYGMSRVPRKRKTPRYRSQVRPTFLLCLRMCVVDTRARARAYMDMCTLAKQKSNLCHPSYTGTTCRGVRDKREMDPLPGESSLTILG